MVQMVVWPAGLLCPEEIEPNPVPFSRSGGRSLSGLKRSTRTDGGFWEIGMNNIPLYDAETRRWWNAIRTTLGGASGLAIIPAWSWDTAPYATGVFEGQVLTTHSDGSPFSDGSRYSQGAIRIKNTAAVSIGATSIQLQIELADPQISGVRFSYNHALYETGFAGDPVNGVYDVPIFPSARAPIPSGSDLNFDLPTCLVHLKEDRGMDVAYNGFLNQRSITWVEATEYWSDLASGVIS